MVRLDPGNLRLDFSPLSQAIDQIGAQRRQNEERRTLADIGKVASAQGFGAGAKTAFAQGRLGVGAQFQGIADQRAQRTKAEAEKRDATRRKRFGNAALAVMVEKDPAKQASMWQSILARHGGELGSEYADPRTGAALVVAEAGLLKDFMGIHQGNENLNLQRQQIGAADRRHADSIGIQRERLQLDRDKLNTPKKLDAAKATEMEQKLRREYSGLSKTWNSLKEGADRVEVGAKLDNAVGDLSLIFGYMKLLDPGSVVREGEFANAENAQGIPERVRNIYNNAMNGTRLGSSARTEFTKAAKALIEPARKRQQQLDDHFTGIAQNAGIDPARVTIFESERASQEPPRPDPAASPLDQARQAIAAGASREAVIQRLTERGIDPAGL